MEINERINLKKHTLIFIFTLLIFFGGFFLSNTLSEKKMAQLTTTQQDLTIDILSLETQFSILAQAPCQNLNESILTQELYDISKKLSSIGVTLGEDNPDFLRAKKYYSILELKHWLLLKRAAKDCNFDSVFILYFYSNTKDCPDCEKQGYILTYFRKKYPFLKIYSFDYELGLSALQSLRSVYSLKKELPILIVNDKVYYGFKNKESLEEILEEYIEIEEATSTEATSTIEKDN